MIRSPLHARATTLFLGNDATGADEYVGALGPERVLLGQANLGDVRVGHVVRYLWARFMPLEFGELDGRRTARSDAIAAAYRQAGLSAQQVRHIDASLKTHAASLLPVVGALYWAKVDVRRLAHSRAAMRLWVRATRESQQALRRVGVPIVPAADRFLYEWVPEDCSRSGWAGSSTRSSPWPASPTRTPRARPAR